MMTLGFPNMVFSRTGAFFKALTSPWEDPTGSKPSVALIKTRKTPFHAAPKVNTQQPEASTSSAVQTTNQSERIANDHGYSPDVDFKVVQRLSSTPDAFYNVTLQTSEFTNKPFTYISKTWTKREDTDGYERESWIFRRFPALRGNPLSHMVVGSPDPSRLSLFAILPHPTFWMEASPDMPYILKKRCCQALATLHSFGILHGNIELRHFLIGANGKVTIIDLKNSCGYEKSLSNLHSPLPLVSAETFRLEERQLRFKLDMPGQRDAELERRVRDEAHLRHNEAQDLKVSTEPGYIPHYKDTHNIPSISEWQEHWINEPRPPKRYLMPGVTPEALVSAIHQLINFVDYETKQDIILNIRKAPKRKVCQTRIPLSYGMLSLRKAVKLCAPLTPKEATNVQSSAIVTTPSSSPSASRKRKASEMLEAPPTKRTRFLDNLFGGPTAPYRSTPLPRRKLSPSKIPHHRVRRDIRKMRRFRQNGFECLAEDLPHPWAVAMEPDNPRWTDPDVQMFLLSRGEKERPIVARGTLVRAMDSCQRKLEELANEVRNDKNKFRGRMRTNLAYDDVVDTPLIPVEDSNFMPDEPNEGFSVAVPVPSASCQQPPRSALKRKRDANTDDSNSTPPPTKRAVHYGRAIEHEYEPLEPLPEHLTVGWVGCEERPDPTYYSPPPAPRQSKPFSSAFSSLCSWIRF